MSTCPGCGNWVEFKRIDGRAVPLGCRCESGSGLGSKPLRSIYLSYETTFCRPSKCNICGAQVFFVRHNGGCVYLDELGWPWPRHGCYAAAADVRTTWAPAAGTEIKVMIGVVEKEMWFRDSKNRFLSIRLQTNELMCCQIDGKGPSPGDLVQVRRSKTHLTIIGSGGVESRVIKEVNTTWFEEEIAKGVQDYRIDPLRGF